MIMSKFIEGLSILKTYFDEDGYDMAAGHEEFHVFTTDRPLSPEDVLKISDLGWFQGTDFVEPAGDEWEPTDYDPSEGWMTFI